MFTVARAILIIGLIFYFSPARHEGSDAAGGSQANAPANALKEAFAPTETKAAEGPWKRLAAVVTEEAVRTVVSEKAQAAGLHLKDDAQRSALEAAQKALAARNGATAEDAEAKASAQGVRCVYRCDGTE